MVAAQFTMDGKWYRAMVRDTKPDEYDPEQSQVMVYFVDYGDDEIKSHSQVCRLKIEFLQLRHQAIECGLAGVSPRFVITTFCHDGKLFCDLILDYFSGDKWSEEAADLFEELTYAARWVPLMAKVQGYREQVRSDRATSPVPLIDLIDSIASKVCYQHYFYKTFRIILK